MSCVNLKMKIALFALGAGHHLSSWRLSTEKNPFSYEYYLDVTKLAEKGKLDFVFFADGLYIDEYSHTNVLNALEPTILLSSLAVHTSHIGLAATASTTYNEPYNLARRFGSIDHISNGRSAWNIVTSADQGSAKNFSRDEHMEHSKRYKRAEEFVEVVKGLWDSWEDEAFVLNKEQGVFVDYNKMHKLNHRGDFFSVEGPLNLSSLPQGHPVLIQAGTSPAGRQLAAKYAEIVFVNNNKGIENAKAYYDELKEKVVSYGREKEDVVITSGIRFILGQTKEMAYQKYNEMQSLINPNIGLKLLTTILPQIDFYAMDLNEPLIDLVEPVDEEHSKKYEIYKKFTAKRKFTLKQLAQHVASITPHDLFIGTPEQLAIRMEEWFKAGACDGFNLMPLNMKEDLEAFLLETVPILQQKNLFKKEYEGVSLRENLGLVKNSAFSGRY
ncbi:LLM class flavin-dependent oxidoreductase [Chengkuizengella axinellae]|uniref:LLM class flavin-dependent oxidoreductase n=1 Tax=Chengkuizengella axinellae TaxID=3064388 RepID=A0ABT9ITQ1_9BACL|nr:LLM class flavin-dependent oxidoreductase [Chengkuizengella sp. 2205SS18-9]MDP5272683.1 LLM class flavin-dependent oxidoreductase [Chengkuizengella sp. 2205SS18-9]